MKKLPIGIQTFREIITGGYVYVDKTQHIYRLINDAKYYFLSRPRRFGKSLLLDTIAEVYGGDKELFKGLWIYSSDYVFEPHPVIRLDMSRMSNSTPKTLETDIGKALMDVFRNEEFSVEPGSLSYMFSQLIELMHKKYNQRVVVLIDEYDKPILDHLTDIETAEANRQVLRGFYGILKSMDPRLRFALITGVTKFTKTSIFSGLNNLMDITMAEEYADICGIPCDSLAEYFGEHIAKLSEDDRFKQYESIPGEIMAWYDGYSWDGKSRLLNPFSLLSFFAGRRFEGYWYASGTPWFLIDLLKTKPESYVTLKNYDITARVLDTFDIRRIEIEPLLFQTGYLTVKEVVETRGSPIYVLDIPNHEVRDAFSLQVLSGLTASGEAQTEQAQIAIRRALDGGDLNKMLVILRRLFASIPYNLHVDAEAYYHSIFYAIMTVLGFDMSAEVSTSKGRVDAVLELDDKVYVMEFKYGKCPPEASDEEKQELFEMTLQDAMGQINNRGYCEKYIGSGKTIYKAAFAFLGRDDIEMRAEQG